MRPIVLRLGAVVNHNRKDFAHGFPPFWNRGSLRLGRWLPRLFFLRFLLLGKLCGLPGFFPLDGITGKQEAVYLEIVGVLLGNGRGDFRKQVLVGLDPAIQVFVQFFPAGKHFPFLPGDFGLSISPRRVGVNAPTQRP